VELIAAIHHTRVEIIIDDALLAGVLALVVVMALLVVWHRN